MDNNKGINVEGNINTKGNINNNSGNNTQIDITTINLNNMNTISNTKINEDKKLYDNICEFFTKRIVEKINPRMSYSLSSPFNANLFNPLYDLIVFSEDPKNEFFNSFLEEERKELVIKVKEFCNFMSYFCFRKIIGKEDMFVTKYWIMNHEQYDYENKKALEEQRDTLDKLANEVWDKYQEFIRIARYILSV